MQYLFIFQIIDILNKIGGTKIVDVIEYSHIEFWKKILTQIKSSIELQINL